MLRSLLDPGLACSSGLGTAGPVDIPAAFIAGPLHRTVAASACFGAHGFHPLSRVWNELL